MSKQATLVRKCEVDTSGLTEKEVEILKWYFHGLEDQEITNKLQIDLNQLQIHKASILKKKNIKEISDLFSGSKAEFL